MWKQLKFYAVCLIIIALAGAVLYLYLTRPPTSVVRQSVTASSVVQQIQQLSELVTVKYSIQKVVGLKEEKIPFGSESILLLVHATVLGGIDLLKVDSNQVVTIGPGRLAIQLPAPQLMHAYINEQETHVWDRSKTWWTPWVPMNISLEKSARTAALEAVQVAAQEMGILKDAQENAETTIRQFLRPLGIDEITFSTAPVPAPSAH